jgi:exonuclease VII small subunit
LILGSFANLRLSTEANRDEIAKLIETMDTGDESLPDAKRLHRQLSNALETLDKAIEEVTSHEGGESDD